MTLPVSAWICLAACAVVILESIILTLLYRKLVKKKKAAKTTKLYAVGAAILPAFFEPFFLVCTILLFIEAVLYLWLIIDFARLLKAKDEPKTEESETESEPKPEPVYEPAPEPHPIDETAPVAEVEELVREAITIEEAREVLSDDFALHLIEEAPAVITMSVADTQANEAEGEVRYKNKTIINVDTLSEHYQHMEHVSLESMKERGLISKKTDFVKVLGRGLLDKQLIVEAQDFSADAVKMIVLTGGHAIHKK
jgi:hypothetical protein